MAGAREALQQACDRLQQAMDTDDLPEAQLALTSTQKVDGGPEAEARALPDVMDRSRPLDAWLGEAAQRAEARRVLSGDDRDRQARDLYSAAARLAAEGLLDADAPEMEDDGLRSTAWSAYEATQLTARARREAVALAWLEDGAKERVRYFSEAEPSRASLEDADCVEGCIARLARGDQTAAAQAATKEACRAAAAERGRCAATFRLVRAGRLEAAADLNEACATGAWRAVALRGGAPWGCAGYVRSGNRRLRLWRDICRERAAAALESCEALRLNAQAVADRVRRLATDERAADARKACRELADAASYEAAVFGALAGDAVIVERALGDGASWEDRAWATLACSAARDADDADAAAPATLDDARHETSTDLKPSGGLAAVLRLAGSATQAAAAALASVGARAIPETLESLDGALAAPLALVWRRVYGDDPNVDRACDAVLSAEARRLCDAGHCALAPAYAGLINEASLRVDAGAAVAAAARGEAEATATREALDAALGPRDAAKACGLAVARVFDEADVFLEKRMLHEDDRLDRVRDADALRVAALRVLQPRPLELVRAANDLLARHGGDALRGEAWACADAILNAVADEALDDAHDLARRGDDAAAAAVETHLGWRCARTAVAAAEELSEDAHARIVAALHFPRVRGGDVEVRWRSDAVRATRAALAEKGAAVPAGWLRGEDAPLAGDACSYLAELALDHARRAGDAADDASLWYARGLRVADAVAAPDAAFAGALAAEDARRLVGKLKTLAVELLRTGGGDGAELTNVGLRDVRWETGLAARPRVD